MVQLSGIAVSPGRVIGPLRVLRTAAVEPAPELTLADGADRRAEAARIDAAAAAVAGELRARATLVTGEARQILEAAAQMAEDPALLETARAQVLTAGLPATRAVWEAGERIAATLDGLGGRIAQRAADVRDVRARLAAQLSGRSRPEIPEDEVPFVLAATDLAPADTATLDPSRVLALVTAEGGPQSHTAILARRLGLPAIVAAPGADLLPEGREVFVDAGSGILTDEITAAHRELAASWARRRSTRRRPVSGGRLADGTRIELLANIGGAQDAAEALAAGAEGAGLLRTELLYLDRTEEPSVAEQAAACAEVLALFAGRRVVVRTLDAGADKPLPFLPAAREPNPALGIRGWRTSWRRRSVLTDQLDAIAEAARRTGTRPAVMAPMITTPAETEEFVSLCRERGLTPAGIMVETPAAALMAHHHLAICDFVSIGTNDLTQHTMAADRELAELAHLSTPWQPAVLTLVRGVCEAAPHPRAVGVCGEAAGDPALAVVLAGLGVRSLSMTPRCLPDVAAVLAEVTCEQAQLLAEQALAARSADEARHRVRAALPVLDELGV